MKKITYFSHIFLCLFFTLFTCFSFSQVADFDNDGILDYLDVDDDNDGLLDTTECPSIPGSPTAQSDAVTWSKNGFDVYVIGNNTTGKGYQESGFQRAVHDKGQPLTVLDGSSDYTFPASSSVAGSATTSIGTFANGTMDYEHNYSYRSYEIHQFRATTFGGAISGNSGQGVYVYPEVGNQTGDYYTVNINFTEPVASFSFDFVDAYDTNNDGATINYEIYADGNLIAYFSNAYLGNDATGNIALYDVDGVFVGNFNAGQNIENTIGFVTDDVVSVVSIRHIVTAGSLATATHDPHGLDTFAYSFPCNQQFDIDVDDDGIPDNVEAQPTSSYVAPSGTVNTSGTYIGLYNNYGTGFTPENTDGTDLADYLDTDSDNDGILDIDENGQAGVVSGSDTDEDGLDNNFDFVTVSFDTNDEVSIGDITDLVNSFGDLDNDASGSGDLDYRDDNTLITGSNTIDFDGENDYLDINNFISNWTEATIMAWVKIENSDSGNLPNLYSIAGQENLRLYISSGRIPNFVVLTQDQVANSGSNYPSYNFTVAPDVSLGLTIKNDQWYHIAGVFDAASSSIKLYINGELVNTVTDSELNSDLLTKNLDGSPHIYSTREFTIGRYPTNTSIAGFGHLNGNIDEVRVLDKALTEDQLQRTVYQEIQNNSGYIMGSVIDKDILDINTMERIQWNDVQAYYPMTTIFNGRTADLSSQNRDIKLNNITTIQEQTAPMPYVANSTGSWTAESTWLHGDVWDIEDLPNKDWSIVQITNNSELATINSHKTLGLIIDSGSSLKVENEQAIYNSWYLELDGTMDLRGDSQLIQTEYSDLAVSSAGKILRRQEGQNNIYRYNYWSSPVGAQSTTANNTDFRLNMLKDVNGNIQFTNNHNPATTTPATISNAWTYAYHNGVTYYDWSSLTPTTAIPAGTGYTQKGAGVGVSDYQYIFEGKPNNGDIDISVTDIGGSGSTSGTTKTSFLFGNPYASALDIHQFIMDNSSVIGGEVYLWEQWAGESHQTIEYQGGYAMVNLMDGVRAYQILGNLGANTGAQDGTKTPSRHLAVGQGFFTEITSNGTVQFNNGQRLFVKEADADGTYNGGSTFFKTTATNTKNSQETTDATLIQKIRLQFAASNDLSRELVLGFSDATTDGFDYGYDAKIFTFHDNDLATLMNGENYVMQAYSPITQDKEVDLVLNSDANFSYSIKMLTAENILDEQPIYLWDTQENIYHDLKNDGDYNFTATAGENTTRFKIVFNNGTILSTGEELELDSVLVYANNILDKLFVKGLEQDVKQFSLINMLGQEVLKLNDVNANTLESGVQTSNFSTGVYIVDITLANGAKLSKKITLN